jgi:hypothetical protein
LRLIRVHTQGESAGWCERYSSSWRLQAELVSHVWCGVRFGSRHTHTHCSN